MKFSNTILTVALGVIFMVCTSFDGAVQNFLASYQGMDVRLEWQLADETDVVSYELARKKPDEVSYQRIAAIASTGMGTYQFVDENLYRNASSGQPNSVLSYRLTVKTNQGTTVYFANLNNRPSSVQRSWGSIKAMFR